jgi:hypothetical protein
VTDHNLRYVDKIELGALLKEFSDHLTCWEVGLRFGSLLYFRMGQRFVHEIKPGVNTIAGSSELMLEGYRWHIYDSSHIDIVATSDTVSDSIVRKKITPIVKGKPLSVMRFNKKLKVLLIAFGDVVTIPVLPQTSGEYIDDNLCTWVVPDGRILSCDATRGFYVDGSISSDHAQHYKVA